MSEKRPCADSTKELLAKKIRNKWKLDSNSEKPLLTGANSEVLHVADSYQNSALTPASSTVTIISPDGVSTTVPLGTPLPSLLNPNAPQFSPSDISTAAMTTTRQQAAAQKKKLKQKGMNPSTDNVLALDTDVSLLCEDVTGSSSVNNSSVRIIQVTKVPSQPSVSDSASTVQFSEGAEACVLQKMASMPTTTSPEGIPAPSPPPPPPPPTVPPAPPVPPILKSALLQPKETSPNTTDTKSHLHEIKQFLSTEMKEIRKSIDDHFANALDHPETGVRSQLKAVNYFLFDSSAGLQSVVKDHTQKIISQKTSVSNICTRMDTLESSFVPLKSLNNKSRLYENRLTALEKTVNDSDEGVDAISLKLGALQEDVTNKQSGLIARVEVLESDFNKVSEAISNGDHEIVLKSQPSEIKDQFIKYNNEMKQVIDTSITTLKTSTETQIRDLQSQLAERPVVMAEGIPSKELVDQVSSLQQELQNVVQRNKVLEDKMHTLTHVSQVHHNKMKRMNINVIQNAAKHMRDELMFGGIRQEYDEHPIEAVKYFLQRRMNIFPHPDDVLEAERGKSSPARLINGRRVNIPPVMFVRVTHPFSRFVLKNTWKLANQNDEIDGYGFYIHVNLPEAQRALRDKWAPAVNKIRKENLDLAPGDRKTVKFAGMNIFIDNHAIQSTFVAPSPQELMNVSVSTQQMMDSFQFAVSSKFMEEGSTFIAYASLLHTADLVTPAYIKMRKYEAPTADNVFMAYRLLQFNGKVQQGSHDDSEYYGDLEIRDILKEQEVVNVIVFVTRHYLGVHIGKKRFSLTRSAVEEVLQKIDCPKQPAPQRTPPKPNHSCHDSID